MKWYSISWFGAVKIECEYCHRYSIEWTYQESFDHLYSHTDDSCPVCAREHLLYKNNIEIKRLKGEIEKWKDAWYDYREIVGRMAWQHKNCPHEKGKRTMLAPQKDVIVDGKVVGAVLSPEAEAAVRRLMSMSTDKK